MTVEPVRDDGVSPPVTGAPPEPEFNIRECWEYARRIDALTQLWIAAGPDWIPADFIAPSWVDPAPPLSAARQRIRQIVAMALRNLSRDASRSLWSPQAFLIASSTVS
jgi:hypothetical protein